MSATYISEHELTPEQLTEAAETSIVELSDGAVYEYWRPQGGVAWFRQMNGRKQPRNDFQEMYAKHLKATKATAFVTRSEL